MTKENVAAGFSLPTTVKRTTVDAEAADRFVCDQPKPKSKRSQKQKAERLTIYLPPKLAERVRVRCAKDRKSLSDAGVEAFSSWVEHNQK